MRTLIVGGIVVVAVIAVASAGSGGDEEARESSGSDTAETPAGPPTIKQALADLSPAEARVLENRGGHLMVRATTPSGGFSDADGGDFDRHAQAIYSAVYGTAQENPRETVIVFRGGLVDTATGDELSKVNTAIYTLKRKAARKISWGDDGSEWNVDWSLYRDFLHPAFR